MKVMISELNKSVSFGFGILRIMGYFQKINIFPYPRLVPGAYIKLVYKRTYVRKLKQTFQTAFAGK